MAKFAKDHSRDIIECCSHFWPDYQVTLNMLKSPTSEVVTELYSKVVIYLDKCICDITHGKISYTVRITNKLVLYKTLIRRIKELKEKNFVFGDIIYPQPSRTLTYMLHCLDFMCTFKSALPTLNKITVDIVNSMENSEAFKRKIADLKLHIAETAKENAKEMKLYQYAKDTLKELTEEHANIMKQYTNLKQEVNGLELEQKVVEDNNRKLKNHKEELQNLKLESDQLKLEDENNLVEENRKLSAMTEEAQEGMSQTLKLIDHLRTCLTDLENLTSTNDGLKFNDLKEDLRTHKQKLSELNQKLEQLKIQKNQLLLNTQWLTGDIVALNSNCKKIENEIHNEYDQHDKKIKNLEKQYDNPLKKKSKEVELLKSEIVKQQVIHNKLTSEFHRISNKLENKRQEAIENFNKILSTNKSHAYTNC